MFELLLQTFWAKKILVKSLLISTLDKVIYYIGTFLQGSTKPLFTSQNRVETRRKKIRPFFFNIRVLDLDFYDETPLTKTLDILLIAQGLQRQLDALQIVSEGIQKLLRLNSRWNYNKISLA
jgi:hypothetical protein